MVVGQALLQSFYDRQLYGIPEQEEAGGGSSSAAGGGAAGLFQDLPFAFDMAGSGRFEAGMDGSGSSSLPRAVPGAALSAATSLRRPSVSPGTGRALREMSSELSVLSRDASEVETPRSPAP